MILGDFRVHPYENPPKSCVIMIFEDFHKGIPMVFCMCRSVFVLRAVAWDDFDFDFAMILILIDFGGRIFF